MLTPVTPPVTSPSTNQRIVHELITYPRTPVPHLAFKNAFLKPLGSSGFFEHQLPWTPCMYFPSPQPIGSRSALLCMGKQTQVWFGNIRSQKNKQGGIIMTLWLNYTVLIFNFMNPGMKLDLASSFTQAWQIFKTIAPQDFPGGPVLKPSPSNAGGCGFDPWSGS